MIRELDGVLNDDYLEKRKREEEKRWQQGKGPYWQSILSQLSAENLQESAMALRPWRKGPFTLPGFSIDSEWRSDLKWQRLQEKLPSLEGHSILDIGCNNGYYMYRMLEAGAKRVLGIDPTLLFKAQFEFLQFAYQKKELSMELWGVDDLPAFKQCFDSIFSMGILYHHRSPLQQLIDMREALKPGGLLILETIGIPGEEPYALTPKDRYQGMRNIFFLPTLSCLINWLEKTRYADIQVISTHWEGVDEQRSTEWSSEVSYIDHLNPNNREQTVEGHPAPQRFLLFARRKPH